jgi:heme-degrading monooxygenase HmoA
MAELVTTGTWMVSPAREEAFVEAWAAFAAWATTMPGAGELWLGRDTEGSRRFVSFGIWASADAAHAWKSAPEFRERMAQVLQHVDDFHRAELDEVATAADGSSTLAIPASRAAV